jgi:uncharacterized membrane protein YfcA
VIETLALGLAAGLVAGLLGVGGGILFVPALVLFRDLSHLEAEATSLVAIVPVALVGVWRQRAYGNVRLGEGLTLGLVALPAAVAGVAIAHLVSERALEVGFACLLVVVAVQLLRRALAADAP